MNPTGTPTPPPGGYQVGGWYNGQQWNGSSFGAAGVINNPNQQGYGQAVSADVVKQTNPNNVSYLQNQGAQVPANAQQAQQQAQPNAPQLGGTVGSDSFLNSAQPTVPNLQDVYAKAYTNNPDVIAAQKQLTDQQTAYSSATKDINDNPFFSEASRTGRLAKLDQQYQQDSATTQGKITAAQAEAERQVNMATGQYNLQSQAYQQNLSNFQTMLSNGAFDNVSGGDLAGVSASTGIPMSMLQSIQKSRQAAQTAIYPAQDANGQLTFTAYNTKTGEVIAQHSAGDVGKPMKGNGAGGGTPADNKAQALQTLPSAFKDQKMTLGTAMSFFGQYGLTPQQIYNAYKTNGQYKPNSSQVKADKKLYNVK